MRTSTALWAASLALVSITTAQAAPAPQRRQAHERRYLVPRPRAVRRQGSVAVVSNGSGSFSSSSVDSQPAASSDANSVQIVVSTAIVDPVPLSSDTPALPSTPSSAPAVPVVEASPSLPPSAPSSGLPSAPSLVPSSALPLAPSSAPSSAPQVAAVPASAPSSQPAVASQPLGSQPSSSAAPDVGLGLGSVGSALGSAIPPLVVVPTSAAVSPVLPIIPTSAPSSNPSNPIIVGLSTIISNVVPSLGAGSSPSQGVLGNGASIVGPVLSSALGSAPSLIPSSPFGLAPSLLGSGGLIPPPAVSPSSAPSSTAAPLLPLPPIVSVASSLVGGLLGPGSGSAATTTAAGLLPVVLPLPAAATTTTGAGLLPVVLPLPAAPTTTTGAGLLPAVLPLPAAPTTTGAGLLPAVLPPVPGTGATTTTGAGLLPLVVPAVPTDATTTGAGLIPIVPAIVSGVASALPDPVVPTSGAASPPLETASVLPSVPMSAPAAVVPAITTAATGVAVGNSTNGIVAPVPLTTGTHSAGLTVEASGTDSRTVLSIPTAILVQPSAETGNPTAAAPSGIPTGMPKLIQPPGGKPNKQANTTLIQLGFYNELNYQFVSTNSGSASQMFQYLPDGVGFGINSNDIVMQSLQPYDTSKSLGYITTLALLYVPSDLVNQLSIDLHTPNSDLYNNPNPTVATLMAFVNPSLPILAGQGLSDSSGNAGASAPTASPGSSNGANPFGPDAANGEPVRTSAAAIAAPLAGGAMAYGAAMILVARRFKKKRQSHRRSSSVQTGGDGWMSGPYNPENSRASQGSGDTSGRSVRTQQISAPVMSENSLGWN